MYPYTGRDDTVERPTPESYFSIQFFPPIVLSVAARTTGASGDQAFFRLNAYCCCNFSTRPLLDASACSR